MLFGVVRNKKILLKQDKEVESKLKSTIIKLIKDLLGEDLEINDELEVLIDGRVCLLSTLTVKELYFEIYTQKNLINNLKFREKWEKRKKMKK